MGDALTWLCQALAALCMLSGTFFMLVTGIGLVRFPDVYCRMHAAGKAGTLGIGLLILAPVFFFAASEPSVSVRGVLAIAFQFLTTPGSTYLLAHACYATNYRPHGLTHIDELRESFPTYADEEFGRE